jgi:hypothetical protein
MMDNIDPIMANNIDKAAKELEMLTNDVKDAAEHIDKTVIAQTLDDNPLVNIGGVLALSNLDVQQTIMNLLDIKVTKKEARILEELIHHNSLDPTTFIELLADYYYLTQETDINLVNYARALLFVGYIDSGYDDVEAYCNCFFDSELVKKNSNYKSDSDKKYLVLKRAVDTVKRRHIVRLLMDATMLPMHILFMSERYKAIGVLAEEMQSAPYSKDRIMAADKLLTHTKIPDNAVTVNTNIDASTTNVEVDFQQNILQQLSEAAKRQKEMFDKGIPLDKVQTLGVKVVDE